MGSIKQGDDGKFVTSLTPQLHGAIVADVESGLFDAQIANKHGLAVNTLKSWVERGLAEDAEEPFSSFAEDYVKAAIALEQKTVACILDATESWHRKKESDEVTTGGTAARGGVDDFDVDSSDEPPAKFETRKRKKERIQERGDWKAAAWFLERRWPLRWGITRQPEGGPKEAIKLPDAQQSRKRRVDEMTRAPPPELIKAFRDAGYDIVRREVKS